MASKKTTVKKAPAPKAAQAEAPKAKLSLMKAALLVLEDSEEALSTKAIVEKAKARGLWEPSEGKTPAQTLYSAFTREIKAKGENARIALAGKGHFKLAQH